MKLKIFAIAVFTLLIQFTYAQYDQYLGEIRIFSGSYAPRGWALCNGQLLPINQNQALFSLLGTTYGGNGTTNFALPNLMGKLAMDEGNGHTMGETAGTATHTLTTAQIPAHTHTLSNVTITQNANSVTGNLSSPAGNYFAKNAIRGNEFNAQSNATGPTIPLPSNTIGISGASQGHNNLQPYTVVTFIIAIQGIYPSQY